MASWPIEEILARGRAAWPGVTLDETELRAALAERDPPGGDAPLADLYLAVACARGVPEAIAAFERAFVSDVPLYIARIDASSTIADEVQQRLRERLLTGSPPRIAEYAARGSLGAWVRVAAVRIAIDLKRSPEPAGSEALERLLAANDEPELAVVKARYRPELDRAVRETAAELSERDATLLRLHFADGVAVERLARSYQVHRATATRWIADARQRFVDGVYRRLAERLGLSRREFESLMPAVVSQLHLSLRLVGA